MFDTIKNKQELGNPSISAIEKELSKKFEISDSTLANLRTAFNNSIKKQLYLQLQFLNNLDIFLGDFYSFIINKTFNRINNNTYEELS